MHQNLRSTERRNPETLDLDTLPVEEILQRVIHEDAAGVSAALAAIPELARAVDVVVDRAREGASVHSFGAGASGRLALLDATEAVPTFGVRDDFLVPHFAGGAAAFFDSRIDVEDDEQRGREDASGLRPGDVAIGVSASGSTAYVAGALGAARATGAATVLVTNVPDAELRPLADIVVCADTGPEALTGSTRLKAGTATKVMLNALSTAVMVRLGRTYSNLMAGVVVTNDKLRHRAIRVIEMATGSAADEASALLDECDGRLPVALVRALTHRTVAESADALAAHGSVRAAIGHLGVR